MKCVVIKFDSTLCTPYDMQSHTHMHHSNCISLSVSLGSHMLTALSNSGTIMS